MKYLFSGITILGCIVNTVLFLYVEWLYISQSFIQLFNPFLQLVVLWDLIQIPLFWISLLASVLGYFATLGASKEL